MSLITGVYVNASWGVVMGKLHCRSENKMHRTTDILVRSHKKDKLNSSANVKQVMFVTVPLGTRHLIEHKGKPGSSKVARRHLGPAISAFPASPVSVVT